MDTTPLMPEEVPKGHQSGYIALIGKPNVGKSTLMNALVGRKLSIVTRKPQTTRHRVLGILSSDAYQIIFLDTPGIIKPRYRLHESMMHSVQDAIRDADLLVFMADATTSTPDEFSLDFIKDHPAILAINKMDRIRKEDALPLVESYMEIRDFDAVVPISATEETNLDVLLEEIVDRLPAGPPFYPKEMISEHPERFFVAEIVREKIFEQYRQEIPYSVQVNVVQFEERDGERDFVSAEIVVARDAQKGILIGKGGSALKQLGIAARKDIEAFLERSIYLDLHVKVREDWRDRPAYLKSYGYRS
ncbi:MAG: GTPase Era [Rhodothermales bacterium]